MLEALSIVIVMNGEFAFTSSKAQSEDDRYVDALFILMMFVPNVTAAAEDEWVLMGVKHVLSAVTEKRGTFNSSSFRRNEIDEKLTIVEDLGAYVFSALREICFSREYWRH